MTAGARSPLRMAPYQMLERTPTETWPTRTEVLEMKADGSTESRVGRMAGTEGPLPASGGRIELGISRYL